MILSYKIAVHSRGSERSAVKVDSYAVCEIVSLDPRAAWAAANLAMGTR
jgi:hypothetical protein